MDWLGLISLILGVMLIIIGIGLTFDIAIIETIMASFIGIVAIVFGLVLAIGGAMIVKEE
ncbi:MFS transporter permease [Methanomicrobium antiquum]|uniref:MFS transporter permease n=1 Tax=Methanomicrobium antiquum TaxID=487686 RepID=A0AAF0JL22_9EURY|nr:MFS transporter permease [Methanomicrobium antiquum]MDD3977633.1 MFS transporter permease [Methanomicrobium sp.]WFN36174.1 MFS transporter permease [Methanomicrobium antiquum]